MSDMIITICNGEPVQCDGDCSNCEWFVLNDCFWEDDMSDQTITNCERGNT